jgi:type III pantothenate kinase
MKMILLVDIGNTRIKWAQSEATLSHIGSATYKSEGLLQVLEAAWGAFGAPAAVYIANVGSSAREPSMTSWIEQKWRSPTHFIKSSAYAVGVKNDYKSPTQLGVDRWLAIIAAHHLFADDVCIFDCGTAITMDLVSKSGLYQGGLIFPGMALMQSSLINNTVGCSAEKSGDLIDYTQLVANNTQDGILRGSLHAVISIIKNQAARLQNEFNLNPTFILTGGDAPTLVSHLPRTYHYYPALVLQGLFLLIKNNK